MLNLINSQFQCMQSDMYGLQWAIKTLVLIISIVGIFPSFFAGLVAKKRGFIYGSIVAFVVEVFFVFLLYWIAKAIIGGVNPKFTFLASADRCRIATFIIAGGSSVLVGGFMGLAGEKLRGLPGKGK
jgi:hypothetical protein